MADITVTAANVLRVSGDVLEGTAGATITAGQALYQDPADGEYKLCDNDNASSTVRTFKGIALNGCSDGQPVHVQISGVINMGATLAVGTIYTTSATAGGVAPSSDLSSGEYTSIIGVALTAANLEFVKSGGYNSGIAFA